MPDSPECHAQTVGIKGKNGRRFQTTCSWCPKLKIDSAIEHIGPAGTKATLTEQANVWNASVKKNCRRIRGKRKRQS